MSIEVNKQAVRRFNREVIEAGDRAAFDALVQPDFINRTAHPGTPDGPESLWATFDAVLRPALSDLTVTVHDQVAEADKVTTRKTISGRHTGVLYGIPATGRDVSIQVIDIVRLVDGRYAEHWSVNNLGAVLNGLRATGQPG